MLWCRDSIEFRSKNYCTTLAGISIFDTAAVPNSLLEKLICHQSLNTTRSNISGFTKEFAYRENVLHRWAEGYKILY